MELDEADIRALTNAANKAEAAQGREDVGSVEDQRPQDQRPQDRRNQNQRNPRNRAFGAKKSGPNKSSVRGGSKSGGQPDPMKTSVGYIGADSFSRQRKEQGPGGRSGGPRRNGGRSR
jgi:23S rRNA pseudouridine2605 synthase